MSVFQMPISLNLEADPLRPLNSFVCCQWWTEQTPIRNAKAYLETARHLSLPPDRCAMVAAHMWDLRAAQKLGMKTIYVPRPDEDSGAEAGEIKSKEEGGEVDFVAENFEGIVRIVRGE